MANIEQALQLATTNAQLAILPTFSDDPAEDRATPTEWLQKIINNAQGGNWTDIQTITHFRNALRGKALIWYNALPLIHIDISIGKLSKLNLKMITKLSQTVHW